MEHAMEGSTQALKPRTDVTQSPKQGYQLPTKRTNVHQIKRKFSAFGLAYIIFTTGVSEFI